MNGHGSTRRKGLISDELLDIARRLVEGDPIQTDLRRAISSTYYAVFHAICQSNADALVGGDPQDRDQPAWRQAYRALEHGCARQRCQQVQRNSQFSPHMQDFAKHFVALQRRRHQADYDPDEVFGHLGVLSAIGESRDHITAFSTTPMTERRAFAVYVLMRDRQD